MTAQSARLAQHLVEQKRVSPEDAAGVVDAVEREASRVMSMFRWMRGRRDDLLSIGWTVVLEKWAKWDPTSGPPGPYFRMVLAHDVKRLIRNEDPRRQWTRGKNKPKVVGRKVSIVSASDHDDARGADGSVVLETIEVRADPLEDALNDGAELVRMEAALLAACGGDVAELARVLDAERTTDPEGVELRAQRRRELTTLREYGQYLGLEDR